METELALFMPLREDQLPHAIQVFESVLRDMGCSDVDKLLPREAIQWQPDGSGFGFVGQPITLHIGSGQERMLTALPHLSGFTRDALPETESTPWFSAAFVFEDEAEAHMTSFHPLTARYIPDFGAAIFAIAERLLMGFEANFTTIGAYFSAYSMVLEPWRYLLGERNSQSDLWAFDLALAPKRLAAQFHDAPDGYAFHESGDLLCIAQEAAWVSLPWHNAG